MVLKPSELSENMAKLLANIIPQYMDKVRAQENQLGSNWGEDETTVEFFQQGSPQDRV